MTRPAVELADILRIRGDCFRELNCSWLGYQQLNVLQAITACRTAALGGHLDSCSRCDHQAISYNSCRNRHCPRCQAQARQRWLARREQDLLSVPYFHVVFTLPHQLNPLCQRYPRLLYNLLFRASAQTMLGVAANPKHLGAKIGFLSILHTWDRICDCILIYTASFPPAVSIASDSRWVHPRYPSSSPSRSSAASFAASFSISFNGRPVSIDPTCPQPSCTRCYSRIGWSMPSPLLAAYACCAILAATLTA